MQAPTTVDPTKARYVKSYAVRRAYAEDVQLPPAVAGVQDAIDIHCHADRGQQDPLALAKHASKNGMGGIVYKTIVGRDQPAQAVRRVQDELDRWCKEEDVTPIRCWAGFNAGSHSDPPNLAKVREQLDMGVTTVWMPVAMHANTLSQVGGRVVWWDPSVDSHVLTPPMSWEEALKVGHYLLDAHSNLKPEIRDIIHLIADHGAAMSFGHATHPEIFAMAEEVQKIGFKRAFADHPFSPFVELNIEQMKLLADADVSLNFTYDELSPLLGVDPFSMYQAIRAVGVEHVTLSSDAGEPLFPNSVECMRLMRGYMRAFGLTDDEIRTVTTDNPRKIVGDA